MLFCVRNAITNWIRSVIARVQTPPHICPPFARVVSHILRIDARARATSLILKAHKHTQLTQICGCITFKWLMYVEHVACKSTHWDEPAQHVGRVCSCTGTCENKRANRGTARAPLTAVIFRNVFAHEAKHDFVCYGRKT